MEDAVQYNMCYLVYSAKFISDNYLLLLQDMTL